MPASPSVISAVAPVSSVAEGTTAHGAFTLSNPLASSTTVQVSIAGWGATSADYTGFMVTISVGGTTLAPVAVAPDGTITLPTGTTGFSLSTSLVADGINESWESLVFVVSQTSATQNIENSWWVTSQVNILDVGGPALPPAPVTITAAPVSPVVEGNDALASFQLSGALPAATTVQASLAGWGASPADYSGFFYTTSDGLTTSAPLPVAPDGSLFLPAGTLSFTLGTHVNTDSLIESNESVVFVVSQTAASANIENSWWVSSSVGIVDPVSVPTTPATITAVTPSTTVTEGHDATAVFSLSVPLAGTSTVQASIVNWGASAADYTGFTYTTTVGGVTSAPQAVAPDGSVQLPAGTTAFALSTHLNTDGLTEYSESIVFVVSQTSSSAYIHDSWWVSSQVAIQDPPAPPSGPTPTPATILASAPVSSAAEGHEAGANFHLTVPLAAGTTVQASIVGWGADGSDYSGFTYTTTVGGMVSAPQNVAPDGTIWLPQGTTDFHLSTQLTLDGQTESYESLVFVVNQTPASANIVNSWWVTSQVNIADTTVVTGGAGRDNMVGSAAEDIFVVPHGSSNADSLTATGNYDVITQFTHGVDKIDLSVNHVVLRDDTGALAPNGITTEAELANAWARLGANGASYGGATVVKYVIGSDTYLAVDSNNDGIIQLGDGSPSQDVFIKIVGVTNFDAADIV